MRTVSMGVKMEARTQEMSCVLASAEGLHCQPAADDRAAPVGRIPLMLTGTLRAIAAGEFQDNSESSGEANHDVQDP